MLSLVSLCPAVFLGDLPLKMEFFKHAPIQSGSTFEAPSGTREWQGKFVGTSSKGKKPSKRVWNKGTNPSVPEEWVRALHKTQE
jgi:hypothetical protein